MRRVLQWVCGLALGAAAIYSWVLSGSFVNRLLLYQAREKYRPETFVVTGASYHRGAKRSPDSWWLQS